MILKGKVWKFGVNIDTDAIIPARYLNTSDPRELAKHIMEDADKDFPSKVNVGDLITAEPLPMRIRTPSNYYWRSNPYKPNGGSNGAGMFAGPDFRLAYWMGRFIRRQ